MLTLRINSALISKGFAEALNGLLIPFKPYGISYLSINEAKDVIATLMLTFLETFRAIEIGYNIARGAYRKGLITAILENIIRSASSITNIPRIDIAYNPLIILLSYGYINGLNKEPNIDSLAKSLNIVLNYVEVEPLGQLLELIKLCCYNDYNNIVSTTYTLEYLGDLISILSSRYLLINRSNISGLIEIVKSIADLKSVKDYIAIWLKCMLQLRLSKLCKESLEKVLTTTQKDLRSLVLMLRDLHRACGSTLPSINGFYSAVLIANTLFAKV